MVPLDLIKLKSTIPYSYMCPKPVMLVVPYGCRQVILIFPSGIINFTGLRTREWKRATLCMWNCLKVKLQRSIGLFNKITLKQQRVKTILCKANTRVRFHEHEMSKYLVNGLVKDNDELRNCITVKRAGATFSLFESTGGVTCFGKDINHMRRTFHDLISELRSIASKQDGIFVDQS